MKGLRGQKAESAQAVIDRHKDNLVRETLEIVAVIEGEGGGPKLPTSAVQEHHHWESPWGWRHCRKRRKDIQVKTVLTAALSQMNPYTEKKRKKRKEENIKNASAKKEQEKGGIEGLSYLSGSGPVSVHARPLGRCMQAGLYCVALRTPDQLLSATQYYEHIREY